MTRGIKNLTFFLVAQIKKKNLRKILRDIDDYYYFRVLILKYYVVNIIIFC